MNNKIYDDVPTRYVASLMATAVFQFISKVNARFGLDPIETAIICYVVSISTKDLIRETYSASQYGYEINVLPDEERPSVSLKSVYSSLNLSRETCRRKLSKLVKMGFIKKNRRNYYFPSQIGDQDKTADFRKDAFEIYLDIMHYTNRSNLQA